MPAQAPRGTKAKTSAAAVRGTVEMLSAPERVKVSTDVGRLDRHFRRLRPRPDVQQRVGVEAQVQITEPPT